MPPPKPRSKGTPMSMDVDVKNGHKNGNEEETSKSPHVIKVMDEDMLARVCQKYEKMGVA